MGARCTRWSSAAPANYRPAAPAPPAFARVGYASQFDSAAFEDLQRIVNAYLGPHDRLLDITNEPALFYYFLGRDPSSRWFAPIGLVDTAELQRNLLADLRRAPPKLIIFDDTDAKMYGLPAMDGVPVSVRLYLISRWVLDHYRPLLESHGRTIYALPGVPPVSSLHLHLHQQPATVGVPFLGQACIWGDAPTFLSGPAEPRSGAQSVPARTTVGARAAGDVHRLGGRPAGWAAGSRSASRRSTGGSSADRRRTPTALTSRRLAIRPGSFAADFGSRFPTWANASKALRVFAIGRDGSVAELAMPERTRAGREWRGSGAVRSPCSRVPTPGTSIQRLLRGALLQIEPPAGSTWSDYRWLEVDAPSFGGFLPGGIRSL